MSGSSFLVGNLVESGSNGGVVAVLLKVKKSLTCVNRFCADDLPSDIVTVWVWIRIFLLLLWNRNYGLPVQDRGYTIGIGFTPRIIFSAFRDVRGRG